MSRSIDERIVEMKFDNKQFEGGIKESLASLQKLEDALNKNISSESIDNISAAASKVDLSGLVKSVESISSRFSTLGIVGMTVIQNITNALLNGLGRAVSSVTDSIVSGGIKRAMNIENAHFQLQGLISDEQEVQTIMKQASDSVDGTAYSYDAAAKAASQFAASGMKSGTQMEQALKGIAGVAATTNSDYEGVARIFTTVAGQGRLMGDQLLQLSSRGMNAAAALKNFFNGVSDGSIKASDSVAETVKQLTGASNAIKMSADEYSEALQAEYEAASEKYNEEYKLRQKLLNAEYKDLQKTLNNEYNARKKAYDQEYNALKESLDKEYKAKQEEFNKAYNELKKTLDAEYEAKKETYDKEYEELSKSLDAEITAQQKANSERLKEADKAYQEDVTNFRKATEEKIALIDKEYTESLKLIDEETYNKTKALEDQITAIDKAAEEEEKAQKQAERNARLTELQNAVDLATSAEAREKAAQNLLEYQKKIEQEELAESRKAQKTKLKEEIAAIKEEANVRKEAAKEKRDTSIQSITEESNATLETMAETYEKEREALQESLQKELEDMKESRNERLTELKKSQNEELTAFRESQTEQLNALKDTQNAELEALKESHNDRLSNLKESQSNELEALKEGQNAQLEALKEKQSDELEALKKANNAKLKELKKTQEEALKNFSAFATDGEITEAAIRDMISKGLVDFDTFAEAMAYTFGDHAKDANETFTGSLANIGAALARTGAMFILPLIGQNGAFVQFFNAIRVKINEFNAALGASNGLAKQFTDWVNKIVTKLVGYIENLKIANTWVLNIGDGTTRVYESATQAVQKLGDGTEKVVKEQIYTPFHAFQDVVRTVANVFMTLVDIAKAVASAFKDVFLTTSKAQSFYEFIEKVKRLSDHFRLSNEQSEKLKTAFTGIFKVVEAVIGVFARLFGVVSDNTDKSKSFGDIVIDLISLIGDVALKIADWINNSETLNIVLGVIGEAIGGLLSLITADKVKLWDDFVQSFKDLTGIDLNEVANSIKETASQIANFLGLGFLEGIDIDSIVQAALDLGNKFLDAIKELFGIHSPSTVMKDEVGANVVQGFIDGITAGFSSVTETAKNLLDSFWTGLSASTSGQDVANDLTEDQEKINPVLDWIKNTLIPTLTGNAGNIIALIGSGGLLYVLLTLAKTMKNISKSFNLLGSLSNVANAYAKEVKAEAFKKVAEAIAIGVAAITACLIALSLADPKKLAVAVGVLHIVILDLVGVFGLIVSSLNKILTVETAMNKVGDGIKRGLTKLGQALKIKAIGSTVKAFAQSIGLIILEIVAIMVLYNQYEEQFTMAAMIVSMIAGAIIGMILVMSDLGETFSKGMLSFSAVGFGILALAVALSLVVNALKDILALDFDWKRDLDKLGLLAVLIGGVGILAVAIGQASQTAGEGRIKATSLLAVCALIATSVWALKEVLDLDLKEGWIAKLGIFAGLFVALISVILAIGVASRLAMGDGLKGTGTILALCAFLITAVGSIMVLGVLPVDNIKKGALGLAGILVSLALMLKFISGLVVEADWRTVLSLAAIVAVVTASLTILSFIDFTKILPGAISLGGVLLCIALVFQAVGEISNEGSWKIVLSMLGILAGVVAGLYILSSVDSWETLVAAAVAIGVVLLSITKAFKILNEAVAPDLDHIMEFILGILATSAIAMILRMLSDISWETLLASAGAIAGVLLAVAATFKIMNGVEELNWAKVIGFIGGCLAAALIGYVLTLSAGIEWQSMLGMAGAIAAVLVAMAVAFAIINGTHPNLAAAAEVVAGAVAVAAIGWALGQAATQDWKSLLAAGVSISVVLLSLAVAMAILAIVGSAAEGALLGIVVLDAFIADLAVVLYALSELTDMDVIKDGGEKLAAIGKAIGDFVGSIIEGIGEGVGRALEAIGTSLSQFMWNAQPFFDGLSDMDEDKVRAAGILAGIVLALSAAEFLDGVTSILKVFTGDKDMSTFGEKLASFGKSVKEFDKETEGVDANHLKIVAEGSKYLIDIAKAIPNEGGLLAKVVGDNDIGEFGKALAEFGKSIVEFYRNTQSIKDVSNWKTIADGTLELINMATKIPNTGGWLAAVVGDNDIAEFGKSLLKYSIYMEQFNKYVSGISSTDGWYNLAIGTAYLIGMAKQIPNTGGLASVFAGDNDIGEFGKSLLKYSVYMSEFNKYVSDLSKEKMIDVADGTIALINMCKKLDGVDTTALAGLGNALAQAAQNGVTGFVKAYATGLASAMTAVSAFIMGVNTQITASGMLVKTSMTDLANSSLTNYITAITAKTPDVLKKVKAFLTDIQNVIKSSDEPFKNLGKNTANYYLAGIVEVTKAYAESIGKYLINTVLTAINGINNDKKPENEGKDTGNEYLKGIEAIAKDGADDTGKVLALAVISGLRDKIDEFEEAGEDSAEGFRNGIRRKVNDVADVARDMAYEARRAIEEELIIESPSKVMRKDGQYTGEGFALGIIDKLKRVQRACVEMAQTPIEAIEDALEEIPELDPTITPIVDLTNVMDAADTINGMFSDALSNIGVNVGKASSSMTRNQQTNSAENIQNGGGSGETNVTFIQNNNSPKALSRIDIYRQTRNQLAQFREAVERT